MARLRTKKLALPPRLDARYLKKKEEPDERTEHPSVNNPDLAGKFSAIYDDSQYRAPTAQPSVQQSSATPEPVVTEQQPVEPQQPQQPVVETPTRAQMQVPTIAGIAYHEYEVTPPPPPAPSVPAGWYADPSGRHQYRYFDGHDWTEHVANNGVASIDPPQHP